MEYKSIEILQKELVEAQEKYNLLNCTNSPISFIEAEKRIHFLEQKIKELKGGE